MLRVAAVLAAVSLAYVGGVVTGVVGSDDPPPPAAGGVIDEAAERIASKAARPVDKAALERAAVEGMLRALGDQWSAYYGVSEFESFQAALEGHYSGAGLWLRRTDAALGSGVQVGSVQSGSPASRAKLRAGDRLVRIGATDVATSTVSEAAALLRGRAGSTVQIDVRRAGEMRSLTVTREAVTTDDVVVERLRGGISRVQISAFTRGVGREVRRAMDDDAAGHVGGVILDLRGNSGGLLDEAVDAASVFLDGGPVVSYERRNQPQRTLNAYSGGDLRTPVVVLVDSDTASAAEVVAAALQDRNRAVVVGARTYGKGSVQEPSELSDGTALELTVGRYLTPSGRALDGVGVEPDVVVPVKEPPEVAEQRAISVLSGLRAALGGTGRG